MSRHSSHARPASTHIVRGSSVSASGAVQSQGVGFRPKGTPSAAGFTAAHSPGTPPRPEPAKPVQSGVTIRDSRSSAGVTTTTYTPPKKKSVEARPNPLGVLRFSPKAWAKMLWFRDRGDTEIGGFGISKRSEPTYVIDFCTIRQKCSSVTVEFDDEDVNKFLELMVAEKGYHPAEVMRIWLHTHPGNSASPSGTDRSTFEDTFGGSDWSIMVIIAKDGDTHCKVRFNNGPCGEDELEIKCDINPPFEGISQEEYEGWEDEYQRNILVGSGSVTHYSSGPHGYMGRGRYSGDDDEWERAWGGHNDGRSGFRGSGASSSGASASAADSGSSSAECGTTQERTRLCDQSDVPPLGGMHRPVASEEDKKWQLNEGVVEQVWQVDKNDDDTETVVTEFGWYKFPKSARITADPGDDIESISDISDEPPSSRGEVSWRMNNGRWEPFKLTQFFGNHIIDLREHRALVPTEKEVEAQAKSQPGFAKSAAIAAPAAATEEVAVEVAVEVTDAVSDDAVVPEARLLELASNGPVTESAIASAVEEVKAETADEKSETQVISAADVTAAIEHAAAEPRKDSNEPGFASPSVGP